MDAKSVERKLGSVPAAPVVVGADLAPVGGQVRLPIDRSQKQTGRLLSGPSGRQTFAVESREPFGSGACCIIATNCCSGSRETLVAPAKEQIAAGDKSMRSVYFKQLKNSLPKQ